MTDSQARRPMDTASGDIRYRGMNMGGRAYGSRSAAQNDKRQQQTAAAQKNAPAANAVPAGAASAAMRGNGDIGRLLGSIKLDEEKVIIIFLIMILARNGADISLLAALGYLLM